MQVTKMLRLGRALRHQQRRMGTLAKEAPRAALCVIGDEVLTGKIQDTNSHFVAKFMFERGVDVKRIVVVPDEMEAIGSTVRELSDLVGPEGFVITTGGIGPTHDDITYEAVAKAFGKGVALHQPTVDGLKAYLDKRGRGDEVNEDRKRMAMLPEGCEILSTATWVPIAVVKNVYILPGIPSMVKDMLTFNQDHFVGVPKLRAIVHTMQLEGDLAKALTAVANEYPHISIGSYVNLTHQKGDGVHDTSYNTKLTIEGRDAEAIDKIAAKLVEATDGYLFTETKAFLA